MERHGDGWVPRLLCVQDDAWLEEMRSVWAHWSVRAGRTETRLLPGEVARRYADGLAEWLRIFSTNYS